MQSNFERSVYSLISGDTGHRLRFLLEFLFVVAVIGILASYALREYKTQMARAQTSEIINLASTLKVDIVAYRAQYGRWPRDADEAGNATLLPHDRLGRYVMTFGIGEEGVVNGYMADEEAVDVVAGQVLSLRLGVSELDSGAPIVPVCGWAKPPEGIVASGQNATTIKPLYLPFTCKEK